MNLNKPQSRFLAKTIDDWEKTDTIPPETAAALRNSYTTRSFDWKALAKYSFIIAIACAVIAFSALIADEELTEFLLNHPAAPCAVTAALSAVFFTLGYKRRKKHPDRPLGNEALILTAILLAAASVTFLGELLNDDRYLPALFLTAAAIYGIIGLSFPSKPTWLFSLGSLAAWLEAETGYWAGAYFLHMESPVRFVIFGAALIAVSLLLMRNGYFAYFQRITFKCGLLSLFLALWIQSVHAPHFLLWSLAFAAAALASFLHGLKHDDTASKGFGLTFFLINLYTKYFTFFWNELHAAAFFALLAVSFWLLGRKAESLWNANKR